MRICEVIGTVTLGRSHAALMGASYRLVVPLSLANLTDHSAPPGEEIVVYDELGAGLASRIAVSEGGEAAQPFYPDLKPVDAYNAAILDHIEIHAPKSEDSA